MYDRVENLSQSYQHFINSQCDGDKSVVLGPMREYARCFMQNFRVDQCNMSIPAAFGIERLNIVIFGLKNTTLIPYVLYVAKNVYSEEERNRIYGILESYIMRRIVVHATTKNYNNLFTSLIFNAVLDAETLLSKLKSFDDASLYIPDEEELERGFATSKLVNLQAKGIIYLIESYSRPANSATVLLGFNGYSLEHLMPKKWRNNWDACNEEEAKRRDTALLTLGNLAIITQSLNASIRDARWDVKKAGKGEKKPGLNLCASGLVTLHETLKKDDWNVDEISNRAEWLAEKALEIWRL